MIAQLIAAAIGMWLLAAPAVLGYEGTTAADVDRILGPITASIGIIAAFQTTRNVRRANLVTAVALLVAPPVLGHPTVALVNGAASGVAIGLLALISGRITKDNAGGWRALLEK